MCSRSASRSPARFLPPPRRAVPPLGHQPRERVRTASAGDLLCVAERGDGPTVVVVHGDRPTLAPDPELSRRNGLTLCRIRLVYALFGVMCRNWCVTGGDSRGPKCVFRSIRAG